MQKRRSILEEARRKIIGVVRLRARIRIWFSFWFFGISVDEQAKGWGMKGQRYIKIALLTAVTGVTLGYQACSDTKFQGQSGLSSQSPSSIDDPGKSGTPVTPAPSGGTTTDNPKPTIDVVMSGYDQTLVQGAQLCVSQVKLTKASAVQSQRGHERSHLANSSFVSFHQQLSKLFSFDFNNLSMELAPQGTAFSSLLVPPGDYTELTVTLRAGCPAGSLDGAQSFRQIRFDPVAHAAFLRAWRRSTPRSRS